MASTFTTSLRIEKQGTGENNTTWGVKENNTYDLIERAISGLVTVPIADADMSLSHNEGVEDQARYMMIDFTGALTANRTVTIPTVSKLYVVSNRTTGGFSVTITTGSGITYVLANNAVKLIFTDGTNIYSNDNMITQSAATKRWGISGFVDTSGIMEVGRYIDFHNADADVLDYAVRLDTDNTTADLYIVPSTLTKRKIWNDGNDGTGSGLDADMVDGVHAADIGFATGTAMLFMQTAAPVGWVKNLTHHNKALRIVNGTVTQGGSVAFTTAFANGRAVTGTVDSHVLGSTEIPTHLHGINFNTGDNSVDHTHSADGNLTAASGGAHTHDVMIGTGGGPPNLPRIFYGGTFSGTGIASNAAVNDGAHTHDITGSTGVNSADHHHLVSGNTGNAGGGLGHTHTFSGGAVNLDVQYVDAIWCTKS